MHTKDRIRKKYYSIRKKKYFDIKPHFFNPLNELLKKNMEKKLLIYLVITHHPLK